MGQCQADQCCKQDCMRRDSNMETSGFDAVESQSWLSRGTGTASQDDDVRQAEKARLKLMVRSFASSAVRGITCETVDFETGRVESAIYMIDRSLKTLTLQPANCSATLKEATFRISRISDVLKDDDLKALPGGMPPGLSMLTEANRKRLVAIRYEDDDGKFALIGILEADAVVQDTFIKCMSILRLYSEANATA